ncbi:MAG TPA: hypothetical protein VFK85_13720 [Anaeromyxobacteraceae bacterium]|nr:hypothetical protein [Anaeromyxobacteraceae bacterium]
MIAAAFAGLLAGSVTVVQAAGVRRAATWRAPARLADTGLYSDFASRTIDPRNVHYSPQYPLWSDGARKNRWIFIPPGKAIDASDPDVWKFPVGTRIWKEFAWSRRVETRYLERTREGWHYAAYQWRDDERDAVLASDAGALTTYEVARGKHHAIPSVADCKNCHRGGRAEILGFSALQLSPDRDPLAPNREELRPDMATLATFVKRGLVRGLPRDLAEHPPRIEAPTPRGRAALGYMHANCGMCHDTVGPLASLGVDLHQSLRRGARSGNEVIADLVDHPTQFQLASAPAGKSVWIHPGSAASSAVPVRMASRSAIVQMPPLGTAVPDEEALKLVREWISQDLRSR